MGVVETGTGRLVKLNDYTVGGKTSTAQKANQSGGYSNEKVVVSFVGMAPALDPKIVLLVAVNEPKGDEKTLFGGTVTGPTFARIIDRVLKYMKVPPDKSPSLISKQIEMLENNKEGKTEIIKLPNKLAISDISIASGPGTIKECKTVPNFKGKSLKQVVKMISEMRLKGLYEGNGIAISQNPAPGTPLPESKALLITFSTKFED
jgi:membrane peptidoglycan carboxypeptidase